MNTKEISRKALLHLSDRLAKLAEDEDLLSVLFVTYSEERPLRLEEDSEGKFKFIRDGGWSLNISITDEIGEGGII